MMTQQEINNLKAQGVLIISKPTFEKCQYTKEPQTIIYKGQKYKFTWLLTYLHKQYYRLDKVMI